jgi:hypothetical protein
MEDAGKGMKISEDNEVNQSIIASGRIASRCYIFSS